MAMPAYVLAFVAVATLDYAGAVPIALRAWFGAGFAVPPIRSTGGVIAVLGLASYPYVYLMARGAFLTHGARALEAAQSLGLGPWAGLLRVAIPLARPWLAGGAALVAMETLADFGAVSVFNYDTFTTAIYKSWYGLFSLETALGLALLLLAFVAIALAAEQFARGRGRFTAADSGAARRNTPCAPGPARLVRLRLCRRRVRNRLRAAGARAPALGDRRRAARPRRALRDLHRPHARTCRHGGARLPRARAGARLRHAAEPGRAAAGRRRASRRSATRFPGTVLAVGVVTALGGIDRAFRSFAGGEGLLLQGTVFALLLGYVARFLAVANGPVQGGFARIRPSLEEAARSLGLATRELTLRLHLPLLGAGIGTALLLVFVDVMKEMPITLMTRPFGWDTLAVRVFEMTAEGEWQRAALPALVIVAAGLLPVALLTWRMERAARAA